MIEFFSALIYLKWGLGMFYGLQTLHLHVGKLIMTEFNILCCSYPLNRISSQHMILTHVISPSVEKIRQTTLRKDINSEPLLSLKIYLVEHDWDILTTGLKLLFSLAKTQYIMEPVCSWKL